MTITVSFDLWELDYLCDAINADHDSDDVRALWDKIAATRDFMRQEEEAQIVHNARQRKLWEVWDAPKQNSAEGR